jgi:hypothetical protein
MFVARRPEVPSDPAVVVLNPDHDVTPESFNAWLDSPAVLSRQNDRSADADRQD